MGNPIVQIIFLEGESFADVIRTAVSLGGDCIAGSMAKAFYGVSEALLEVLRQFEAHCATK